MLPAGAAVNLASVPPRTRRTRVLESVLKSGAERDCHVERLDSEVETACAYGGVVWAEAFLRHFGDG